MKHLKKYNESSKILKDMWPGDKPQKNNLYLIEEDYGDSLGFKGMYNNIEDFIKDMSVELLEDPYIKESGLNHEITKIDGRDAIKFTWGSSYDIYYFTECELNKLY